MICANRRATQFEASGMTKRLAVTMFAAVMLTQSATSVHTQNSGVDKVRADAFDARLFAGTVGDKAYACFVRHYDADHLAQHPKQKAGAMQFPVTAEIPPGETVPSSSFRLGVNYLDRGGDFDSSGIATTRLPRIIRLTRITLWQRNRPDDEAGDALLAGADDRISPSIAPTCAIAQAW